MWFYVDKQRQQRGPVSVEELKTLLARDEITKRTHLWQEGRAEWVRLETLAAELGIAIATPPPTPAATMAMPSISAPVPAAAPPAYASAPPAYVPAQPAFTPPQAAPPMGMPQSPPMGAPPMAPQAPAFPSFPQAPAPGFPPAPGNYSVPTYAAPVAAGGGAKKFLGTFVASLVLLWFAYAKLGHLIPGLGRDAKAELLYVIEEYEPARAEIRKLFTEKSQCPGKELPISSQQVRFDYYYGSNGTANECALEMTYPADFKLKAVAGTRIFFLLRGGEWLCGMSAPDAIRPANCDKIDATRN